MNCQPTFIKSGIRQVYGMTLIEILVALAIGMVVLAVVGSLSLWSGRSFAAMANYADLDNASRNALDRLTSEVRQVQGLISYTTNAAQKELALLDSDGQPLYYRYNSTAKTLVKVKNGNTQTLLRDCTTLNFNLFQRNTVSNTFNQYQVASGTNAALTCKVVQINWICSRRLLPTVLINSESVQTAKIVIRHH
jgi:Tfp pilus assembly protein PilW